MAVDELLESAPIPVSAEQVAEIVEEVYGLTGETAPLPGERDRNFLVQSDHGQYNLKLANPAESRAALEMQQRALCHIRNWDPDVPVPRPVPTLDKELTAAIDIDNQSVHVRMTSYLPGRTIEDTGYNSALRLDTMRKLARIDYALRTFSHPMLSRSLLWNPLRTLELRDRLDNLPADKRRVAETWLRHFEASLVPRLSAMPRLPIHGDFNPANLIVDPEHPRELAGVIDFGDMTTAPHLVDTAIAVAYQCLGQTDPAEILATGTAEYHTANQLDLNQVGLVADMAITRLVQSLVISAWRSRTRPENRDYILMHAAPVWEALQKLVAVDLYELRDRVVTSCETAPRRPHDPSVSLRRRRNRLGPGMRLTYDRPLHVVSASGVHLTDTEGHRYLDAYNNVAHVGHGHPDVVAALVRQASRLNTNTRYLVDEVTAYADRLAGLLPDPLEVVFFANSGSEANDLAWRIARTVTGRRGMVVTEHAYHGSTYLTMATSPEELGIDNTEHWVATIPAPWPGTDGADVTARALTGLDAAGESVAAFACDTVFSSDGIIEPPDGLLASIYETVRAAGGLCIADEVQAGFGRVGSRMWGFAGHGVIPDMVTLGKPMGNGHPLAALVTTAAIAADFADSGYYFSTFAGNPVSAAVGEAVLDVMERDRLAAQADRVGSYLRQALCELAARHGAIAEVRGPGMFIGVELRSRGEPAAELAHRVHNEMRNRHVLIGRTGPSGNVLKIRPPLVFNEDNADLLISTLDNVLGGV